MAALFDSMDWVNEENDLSTVIGSGTRIASEIARDDSGNTPKLPIPTINGEKYLEVDQSANRRAGSKISPIWQHGLELRAMDSPNLDKYWLCGLCPSQTAIMKITKGTNSNTTAAMRHLKTIDKVSFYSIDEFISSQLPGRPHSPLGRCYTLSASLVGLAGRRVGSADVKQGRSARGGPGMERGG